PWNRRTILDALRPFKEIDIRNEDGSPADSILYQLRADGKNRNLFLCNTDRVKPRRNASIAVSGKWDVTQFDTMTGQSHPLHARVEGARTIIPWSFDPHGHVLLSLKPAGKHSAIVPPRVEKKWTDIGRLADPVAIALPEPNALM